MASGPPVLTVTVHDLTMAPTLTALCAGYESGEWRMKQLARTIINALPSFALTYTEADGFDSDSGMEMMGRAVHSVYATEKYEKRGEFGEVLLHLVIRQVFNTIPAVSKIYFQDNDNHVVKGFDAVHVVADDADLELWLGEVKFYESRAQAIAAVREELHQHTDADYLRREFAAITAKIDRKWPHSDRLALLLHPDTSLDDVFDRLVVPVLLTYDSPIVAARVAELADTDDRGRSTHAAYLEAFEAEMRAGLAAFAKDLPVNVAIRLIFVPLHQKKVLLTELHERLKSMQRATE